MKKLILLLLLLFTSAYSMHHDNAKKNNLSCCYAMSLFCISYTAGTTTFTLATNYFPEEIAFPCALGIITSIGTWNIGKGCYTLKKEYNRRHKKEKKD